MTSITYEVINENKYINLRNHLQFYTLKYHGPYSIVSTLKFSVGVIRQAKY